jgi:hypothetical protein
MQRAWTLCSANDEEPNDTYRDWLLVAINHYGGWIADFWVHYCNQLRNRAGGLLEGIPDFVRDILKQAVEGTNSCCMHARISLTPWIGSIFSLDRDFAVVTFIPLFAWDRDAVVAQQTWSVFLGHSWGSTDDLEILLLPHYKELALRLSESEVKELDQLGEHALHNFGHRLAALALSIIPDPLKLEFFREFLPLLSHHVRGALSHGIGEGLAEAPDEEHRRLWNTWLETYLQQRLIGIPVPFVNAETKHMLYWCLHLDPVFTEAVDLITKTSPQGVWSHRVYDGMLTHHALDEFPIHSCRLVNAAVKADEFPHLDETLKKLHERFRKRIARSPEFSIFESLLYDLGWQKP